jgi:hypothetical protein
VTRLASALQLIALALLIRFLVQPTGANATGLSFFGVPLVGLSILLYALTLLWSRSRSGSARDEGRSA